MKERSGIPSTFQSPNEDLSLYKIKTSKGGWWKGLENFLIMKTNSRRRNFGGRK
jgi:hypothetical protein